MHILHLIGSGIIIALLLAGVVLYVQIVKLEKEILIEKNEKSEEVIDSALAEDRAD